MKTQKMLTLGLVMLFVISGVGMAVAKTGDINGEEVENRLRKEDVSDIPTQKVDQLSSELNKNRRYNEDGNSTHLKRIEEAGTTITRDSEKKLIGNSSWEFGETRVYDNQGNVMDETLPPGVFEIEVHGAKGSNAPPSDHQGSGGAGGYIKGRVKVESESNLSLYIGESGNGQNGGWGRSNGGDGGFDESSYDDTHGGGGAGSTEILLEGSFLVAADGGGGGGSSDYDGWVQWNAAGGGGGGRGGSGGSADDGGSGNAAQGSGHGG
ncbi:MAG: glycine rich domain-containing protein, partial [Candidatus Aenigmatarchaeota archaeon]